MKCVLSFYLYMTDYNKTLCSESTHFMKCFLWNAFYLFYLYIHFIFWNCHPQFIDKYCLLCLHFYFCSSHIYSDSPTWTKFLVSALWVPGDSLTWTKFLVSVREFLVTASPQQNSWFQPWDFLVLARVHAISNSMLGFSRKIQTTICLVQP